MPTLIATTTTTGIRAATAPLTLIRAVSSATSRQIRMSSFGRFLAAAADHLLTRPGGDAGGVERVRHHEQCGDEDHRRVAAAGPVDVHLVLFRHVAAFVARNRPRAGSDVSRGQLRGRTGPIDPVVGRACRDRPAG